MSIAKNFAYNSAYRVLLIITPIVVTPYLSRIFGTEGVGVYSYTYSVAQYFVLFAMLGMSNYGVRTIAMARKEDRCEIDKTFSGLYYSQLAISLIVIAAYLLFVCYFTSEELRILSYLWAFWIASAALDISWLFFGLEDFKRPTIRNIVIKIVELVALFALVKTIEDLWIYVLITSLGFLLSQASLWIFSGKLASLVMVPIQDIAIHLKPNCILFLPVISIGLLTTVDRIVLGALSTMNQVGLFDYSEKICKIPQSAITAMGTVMLPRMSSLFSSGEENLGFRLIEKTVWFMVGSGLLMAFGIAAIAPEFAPVFLGEEFADCAGMIMVISAIIPISTVSNIIGKQYLLPTMHEKSYTVSIVMGLVANLSVCAFLAPNLGAYGACIASVVGEIVILGIQCHIAKGKVAILSYLRQTAPFVIIGIAMMLMIRIFANELISHFGMSPVTLILEVLIGALVAIALCVGYFGLTHNENFTELLAKMQPVARAVKRRFRKGGR